MVPEKAPETATPRASRGSHDHQLPRKLVDTLVAVSGHDEGVAEENPEPAVGGDRIGLGHEHHAGTEGAFERLGVDPIGEDMRAVADEIDAVGMNGPRLHALLAEEAPGRANALDRIARLDLGHHALEAR